jgi:hypothetical protein
LHFYQYECQAAIIFTWTTPALVVNTLVGCCDDSLVFPSHPKKWATVETITH